VGDGLRVGDDDEKEIIDKMASNRKDQPATSTPPPVPPTPKTAQESARERALEAAYHQRWQREAAHQKEQVRRRAIRRGEATELGDRWKNSERSEVNFQALTEQQHEGSHVYNVDVKAALLRKVDGFTLYKAYKLLAYLYPTEARALDLAYPLDDDVKPKTQTEIGEELHCHQTTAGDYIRFAKAQVKRLYEGLKEQQIGDDPELDALRAPEEHEAC